MEERKLIHFIDKYTTDGLVLFTSSGTTCGNASYADGDHYDTYEDVEYLEEIKKYLDDNGKKYVVTHAETGEVYDKVNIPDKDVDSMQEWRIDILED